MFRIRLVAITAAPLTLFTPGAKVQAQNSHVAFPADFDKYVLYATYDRGGSKEEAFATPETLAIVKSGKPLPPGTKLVLGIWSNYKLTDYFVMEKGVDPNP